MPQTAQSAPVSCLTCPARRDGLCTELTEFELRRIKALKAGDRRIGAGKDIFAAGEPCNAVYNLVEGWAFRYTLQEDGRRQILDFILPGAVIGFHPAKGARATYGVQALTPVTVCSIRHQDLTTLVRELPDVGLRLAWLISRDRSLAYDHLTCIGRQSAHQRVAHLILELFVRYRAQWPGTRIEEMHLPLTQEHIGDALGLTSVHVNRVLRDLRAGGVLEFHYRRLNILDPDKLNDVAEPDPNLMKNWMSRAALSGAAGESASVVASDRVAQSDRHRKSDADGYTVSA